MGPGALHEVRAPGTRRGTVSGYFNDRDGLVEAACELSGQAPGVYPTLNPVPDDLLARAANHVVPYAKHTTSDSDITVRRWLPVDFDPVRPAGISSTNEEHAAAVERARACQKFLAEMGFPDPILAESGNGAHLLYRIDLRTTMNARRSYGAASGWLSDALCRLATGGGFSTRELYSDDEEVIFDAMRPVILTGIEEFVVRADLLDRSIVLSLPNIPDERRRPESRFWHEFKRIHSQVLGALLDAVSAGLRNLPHIQLSKLPRMADFAVWATAAEPAPRCGQALFVTAYTRNRVRRYATVGYHIGSD